MVEEDRKAFYALIGNVYAFYRVDCSPFALGVWWEACKGFDATAVHDALNRHAVNPDNGQFVPKPADVVKLIGGGTQDSSLVAWSKVDRAIRSAGPYRTVVFDDPIIHRVIEEMGGWPTLCHCDEDEYPFRAKEFQNRYRGFMTRGGVDEYPRSLTGISDAQNIAGGFRLEKPLAIGNPDKCAAVLRGGSESSTLSMKQISMPTKKALMDLAA